MKLGENRTVRVRYQRRRMDDVGFPDFAQPYFFNATSLPHSNLDRVSARYEARAVTPWLANLSLDRPLPANRASAAEPAAGAVPGADAVAFFPISVFRLDILSDTEQRVSTPGVDLQAVFVPASNHLLTTGLTFYRDRSSDSRTTSTTMSLVGQVALGQRGPAPVVFPSPVQLGPPSIAHPVRVPDASLARRRDVRAGRVAAEAEPVARRRPARRLLQRHDRSDAGLRRRVRRRRRATRRSIPRRCPIPTARRTRDRR